MKQLQWQCKHLSHMSLPNRPVIRANHGTVAQMQRANGDLQCLFSGLGTGSSGALPKPAASGSGPWGR
jgi:hypothetical protein